MLDALEVKRLEIDDPSRCSEARREALDLAEGLGFGESDAGRLALVITEAATNLLKHAGGGEILLRRLQGPPSQVEVVALDRGPGMANVGVALRDGYSTRGSPGTGLGAMARLSSLFDLYSAPGGGTVLVARVAAGAAPPLPRGLEVGVVCRPKPGEEVSGDGWAVESQGGRHFLLAVDGLGHGPFAAEAAARAVRAFLEGAGRGCPERLEAIHEALRPTRGAAGAVAELRPREGLTLFTGVGNISASIHPPKQGAPSRRLVSHHGTLGHQANRFQEFSYPWTKGSLLILHSDGLSTHFKLEDYPGLSPRHPALTAAVLYRDFNRRNDDLLVLVARVVEP
jgi:anti-sigma regulatory factor (Ser/Thr protein kinase)